MSQAKRPDAAAPPSNLQQVGDAEERDIDFFQNPGRPPSSSPGGQQGQAGDPLGGSRRQFPSAKPPAAKGAVSPSSSTPGAGSGHGSGSLDSFTIPTPSTPDSPLARSPSLVHGQVGSVVLHFHIGSAHFGPEKVKPLTYFTLETTVTPLPAGGPPQKVSDDIHDWTPTTTPIFGDRRYSEFAELRRCLCYSFPWLVVPPLPPKSHLEGMKTFWADQDALMMQQRTLEHFMREVAGLPVVLSFPIFHKFCTLSRDTQEFVTLNETIRVRNSELDAQRGLSAGGIGEATKLVKSVYTTVSGWFGGGANGNGSGQHIPANLDEQVRKALSESKEYQHWSKVIEHWTQVKRGVEGLLAPANSAVQLNQLMYEDQGDCAAAFEGLAELLSESELLRKCSGAVLQGAFVDKTVASNHMAETARDLHNFCGALQHEVCWLDAAIEAARSEQYVIRTKLQQQILDGPSAGRPAAARNPQTALPLSLPPILNERERLAQWDAIHAALTCEMERFRYAHQHRIRHLVVAKVRRALHYVDDDLSFFAAFSFRKETETPQWLLDCDMPPGCPSTESEDRGSEVWINSTTSEQHLADREEALRFFALKNSRRSG